MGGASVVRHCRGNKRQQRRPIGWSRLLITRRLMPASSRASAASRRARSCPSASLMARACPEPATKSDNPTIIALFAHSMCVSLCIFIVYCCNEYNSRFAPLRRRAIHSLGPFVFCVIVNEIGALWNRWISSFPIRNDALNFATF